jgi:hypothetical protein
VHACRQLTRCGASMFRVFLCDAWCAGSGPDETVYNQADYSSPVVEQCGVRCAADGHNRPVEDVQRPPEVEGRDERREIGRSRPYVTQRVEIGEAVLAFLWSRRTPKAVCGEPLRIRLVCVQGAASAQSEQGTPFDVSFDDKSELAAAGSPQPKAPPAPVMNPLFATPPGMSQTRPATNG